MLGQPCLLHAMCCKPLTECIGNGDLVERHFFIGGYYAMDRDNNYDRVEKAYLALTKGEGLEADSAAEGIQASYDREAHQEAPGSRRKSRPESPS